ncbi:MULTISPECIES: DUF397 domain-containing protein [unclassified Nocardiopsis]|uniref:DUF397 domain-containing protein n=1 Tax=unclassified Nocardiopsis TaxID=2649073 RepID=UPI0033CBD7D1
MRPHTHELTFRKSSYSGGNGNCVEVADLPGEHLVRDTQNRDHGTLGFAGPEWAAALGAIRTDQV